VERVSDFLLELRSEEIPARMQARAREDLAKLFAAELARAGLQASALTTYATPRRLALIARDLPDATEAVSEEVKGPKTSAPPQALEGFLRKTGLTREQLTERDGVLFAVTQKPGRATADVLAEAISAIVRAFPWPKSMRWGEASASTESLRWVRPLQGIVAIFGEELVPVAIAGVESAYATLGHRFHHPGLITIGGANDYVEKLRACHVIVDQDERAALIRSRAQALASDAGLVLVEDEGLVAENAGLTEWPVPLLGRFDEAFLQVPPEVIQLTARVNQKYFVCRSADGALANAFICTANIDATDGGAKIVEGNRKVLAARLSDAKFFYDTDLKVPLEEQAAKLGKIVFHEKLGTVADKVERVAKLARWLVEEGIVTCAPLPPGEGQGAQAPRGEGERNAAGVSHSPSPVAADASPPSPGGRGEMAALAERAARLCKADLVTGMVGEFPELQGLMGGYYALAQGEDPRVAEAIRDHYKPVGQGDDVPTAPVTVAVSLADKLDTIAGFFIYGEKPTGSKDPFALRRAALGVIQTVLYQRARMSLYSAARRATSRFLPYTIEGDLLRDAADRLAKLSLDYGRPLAEGDSFVDDVLRNAEVAHLKGSEDVFSSRDQAAAEVVTFFADRLKVQQREAGVRHDLIDAVFALGGEDDLVRLLARVRALQAFVGTEDGANLLAGYKRAANILKKEGYETPSPLVGEGRGPLASASGKGEGDVSNLAPPHPSATASFPPSPTRGEGITLSYTPEPAESALIAALDSAEPAAARAVAAEEFEAAMAALASLRVPIDAFFDTVTVNDPSPEKRAARLALLARVRAAVHTVADFSRIDG
jgi:glycyl-tRNA synthetase beta chain